jgi:toxin HigB-1
VEITFRDRKLEKLANDNRKLDREYGKLRADKIKIRLDQLRAATSLEDTRYLPGKYHELKENRKGQWSCDLDQPYRLIFTSHEKPIPENEAGQFIWSEIKGVEIIEIKDYH